MFEPCLRIKKIMDKYGFPWFIAGGWAIDLFLNKETRVHENIKIGTYRKYQMKLYKHFEKYKKYYIDNKSRTGKQVKREWNKEYLRLPIHELYIEYDDIEIGVLLHEKDEDHWLDQRNPKIRLEEDKVILFTDKRIPYLCPEIVSLYKTKEMREKDVDDIANALRKMNEAQKQWLIDNIEDQETRERITNPIIASR